MSHQQHDKNDESFWNFNFFTNCCAQERDDLSEAGSASKYPDTQNGVTIGRDDEHGVVAGDNLSYDRQSDYESGNPDWTDVEDYQYSSNPNVRAHQASYVNYHQSNQHEIEVDPGEPLDIEYIRKKSRESDEEKAVSEISNQSKKISKNKKKRKGSEESKEAKGRNKRRPWQPHEDAKVLELVAKYGQSWALLASMITGRTGKQIRDRYLNKLKPNIKKGDWTPAEDNLLVSLYYQIGHKWSKIATYLPGRTEGQVKNRFYSHVKKKMLKDVDSPSMEGSTSPMTREDSPTHANQRTIKLEPVTQVQNTPGNQHQQVYYQNHQQFPQQQNQHLLQTHDPTDVISYEQHNGGYQNQLGNNIHGSEQSTSESFVSYNSPQIQLEKEIDSVLSKFANVFDAPIQNETSGGVNQVVNPESNNTFEKLDRIEQLRLRQKNLEYLLQKTMQEISSGYSVQQLNGFH